MALLLLGCLLCVTTIVAKSSPPNIIFILADDLGWDDVSFHGSEIQTPYIDKLAQDGVILNNYYVQPMCTPTRGALLTGRYPIHTGLQHYVIAGSQPYGLPLTEITLAQHLKTLGYSTHAVGKWHLGFCSKAYLPENRGFDSHLGYYLGLGDFFDHYGNDEGFMGYDFHFNGEALWNQSEVYSTDIFTQRATTIIQSHDQSKPLFLYLAYQAVHVGNEDDKIQVPQKYVNRFPYIKDVKRRMFAGVVSALDDAVGLVYQALNDTNLLDNTLIVFSTDNGGPANGYDENAACNWPLRGTKNTLWQGGVRGVGLVHSQLLHKTGYINNNLMHVTDWLPTLYTLAGGNSTLQNIDGIDQWKVISDNVSTIRNEVLLNIDPIDKNEALIMGDFKLIFGDISDGKYDGWYPPLQSFQNTGDLQSRSYIYDSKYLQQYHMENHHPELTPNSNESSSKETDIVKLIEFMDSEYRKWKEVGFHKNVSSLTFVSEREPVTQTSSIIIDCGTKPANATENCQPQVAACLYHLKDDPCEYNNLASALPSVLQQLQVRLDFYRASMVPPGNKPEDPNGDPQLHGGVWMPWL